MGSAGIILAAALDFIAVNFEGISTRMIPAHCLEVVESTPLHMLMMLKRIAPFILMTATFSADMLEALASLLDEVVVPGSEQKCQELRALEAQQKECRQHVIADEIQPLSTLGVLETQVKQFILQAGNPVGAEDLPLLVSCFVLCLVQTIRGWDWRPDD